MKTKLRHSLITLLSGFLTLPSPLQAQNPYIINGDAFQESCNCYTLTPDRINQAGSVWNKNKIDLTQSFDYKFNVFLGCKDSDGADGIAFVLQPNGTSIGTTGNGLGFEGIDHSIGIPIDTWQNSDFNDPVYDHTGIYSNGDLSNWGPNDLAGPIPVLPDSGNIEDCQWHILRIVWDAPTTTLSLAIDGNQLAQIQNDLVNTVFQGNPEVFWGFSAGTGSGSNIQKFCTSLNPGYSNPASQKTCAPASVIFQDSSASFGSIVQWLWDFGDGTFYNGQSPPPHPYPIPGIYTVKLNIQGNDGCLSDTLKREVIVGSKPVAGFSASSQMICAGLPDTLADASLVQYGTITQWEWDFNNGQSLVDTTRPGITRTFPAGMEQIQLISTTEEGCVSDPVTQTLNVGGIPQTTIFVDDACAGDPVRLIAGTSDPAVPIRQWYWTTGDGGIDSNATAIHHYTKGGEYPVTVYAVSDSGCTSDTMTAIVSVYQTNANAGKDTVVEIGQTFPLHGSGGDLYTWTPATGLNDPSSPDPEATLNSDIQYILTAYTSLGCASYDTIQIKAYEGPAIYMPNAFTPDNNGRNDRFRPIAVGMASISYFTIYNRFGQPVFSSRSASEGWDGTFQGRAQPTGTYVWMIKGEDNTGKTYAEKGTVVLIR